MFWYGTAPNGDFTPQESQTWQNRMRWSSCGVFAALFPRQIKERLMLDRSVVQGRAIELCEIDAAGKTVNMWANWGFDVLNVYVASHLMWNFDTDVEQLLTEFFPLFYGPAGATMKKFYDQMEARWTFAPYPDASESGWCFESCWQKTYPPEFVAPMMNLLRQAVQDTQKQAPYYQRALKTL